MFNWNRGVAPDGPLMDYIRFVMCNVCMCAYLCSGCMCLYDILLCAKNVITTTNRQLCESMGFPYSGQTLPLFLTGQEWLILKNYPEFEFYRDISFYFKYFLGTNPQVI